MKPSERFEPKSDADMSGDVVVQLLQLFEQHGIEVVVDGGWGVDALLGEQTRSHGDLDIALPHKDLFREAAKRGITIKSVHVDVEADWGGEPVRAQNVTLTPRVEAEASEAEILTLIEDTDRLAEIPNSLRLGTPVTLRGAQAVAVQK